MPLNLILVVIVQAVDYIKRLSFLLGTTEVLQRKDSIPIVWETTICLGKKKSNERVKSLDVSSVEWSTLPKYIWKRFAQDSLGFAVVTNNSKISMPYISQSLFLAYATCLMCWRQALLFLVSAQIYGESTLMYMLPTAPGQEKKIRK